MDGRAGVLEIIDTIVGVIDKPHHKDFHGNGFVRGDECRTMSLGCVGIKESTRNEYPDDRAVSTPLASAINGMQVTIKRECVQTPPVVH